MSRYLSSKVSVLLFACCCLARAFLFVVACFARGIGLVGLSFPKLTLDTRRAEGVLLLLLLQPLYPFWISPAEHRPRGNNQTAAAGVSYCCTHTRFASSRRWVQGKRACPSRRLRQATASDTGKRIFAGPFFCRAPIDRSRSAILPDARPDGRS
ncbi:unnamed protein product [Ectocarpus sp. 8 AP-2014]